MKRWAAITAVCLLAVFGAAKAQTPSGAREVEVGKLFPYLAAYRDLPAAARDRFRLAYRLSLKGAPLSTLQVAYLDGGRRVPVALAPDGRVLTLPSQAMLKAKGKAALTAPKGSALGMDLEIEPVMAPATQMDARELAAALEQAAAGAKKAAGVFGFAAPRLERVIFRGGVGGMVVLADGRSTTLPLAKGLPVFDPAKHPGARFVRFSKAPARMAFDEAK